MKCHVMGHFIWVFTACQSTYVGVTSIQNVNCLKRLAADNIRKGKFKLERNMYHFTNSSFYNGSVAFPFISATKHIFLKYSRVLGFLSYNL